MRRLAGPLAATSLLAIAAAVHVVPSLASAETATPERSATSSVAAIAEAIAARTAEQGLDLADGSIAVTLVTDGRWNDDRDESFEADLESAIGAISPAIHEQAREPSGEQGRSTARALARRGFIGWIAVTARRGKGGLQIDLRGYRLGRGGMLDALHPTVRPLAPVELLIPLDAQLAAYLIDVVPLEEDQVEAVRLSFPASRVRGLVPSGESVERPLLYAMDERGVTALEIDGKRRRRIRSIARADWPELGRPKAPSRRTFGTGRVDRGRVFLRVSHLDRAVEAKLEGRRLSLNPTSDACAEEAAFPLDDGCGLRVAGRDYFRRKLIATTDREAPPRAPSGFYTRRVRQVRARDGVRKRVEVVVTPRGRLATRVDGNPGGAAGFGASLALSDVDLDGRAELLTSSPNMVGEGDQLVLLRIEHSGALSEIWRSDALTGSVLHGAALDVDGDGVDELLALEQPLDGEGSNVLWVIQ